MNIKAVARQNKRGLIFIFLLILADSALSVLYPLFIGYAIDDAIKQTYSGAIWLAGLGVTTLVVASARRFYDSRFYAKVLEKMTVELNEKLMETSSSTKAARFHMLNEMVEFFENNIPALVRSVIGLAGTLMVIATLNLDILWLCLGVMLLVIIVYGVTGNKTLRYNKEYNNELEGQVDIVSENNTDMLRQHIRRLMKWNIKLSDLEMINFSIVWLTMIIALVYAINFAAQGNAITYGAIFSLVMYFFQFMEDVISLPLFYQQWLRLKEIGQRLSSLNV